MAYILNADWTIDALGGRRQASTRYVPALALFEIVVDGGAQLFNHQTVSNCRVERFSLEERFERWSNSTPTTSLDSL